MGMTLANRITIGRIILVPVFIAVLMSYTPEREYLRWWALGIYLLAQATDVIDGYVARRFYQKTRAGSILDPLADKLLQISAFIILYAQGAKFGWPVMFPLWLVVAFVARDVVLLLGALLIELKHGLMEIKPNALGKLAVFLQAVCIVAVFFQIDMVMIAWLALAAAAGSGLIYMKEGIKVLNDGHF